MPKLFKSTLIYTFQQQTCNNVLWYYAPDSATKADDLADFIATNLAPALSNVQANQVVWDGVKVEEMVNGTGEMATVATTGLIGKVNNECNPSLLAFGFTKAVASNNTRAGAMRLGGVAEIYTLNGFVSPTYQTDLETLAAVLATAITTLLGQYIPVVTRYEVTTYILNTVIAGLFKRITTQNSRKHYTNTGSGLLAGGRGIFKAITPAPVTVAEYLALPATTLTSVDPDSWTTITPANVPVTI